ncbi:MAG TPA: LysR substrate-binding domain-containing protein [Polyangia bacterium]|nr:LysR substrate-binding domain-containing protein [Polyangia bacterium]
MNPHAFTLRQLQYAIAVAEELSFRRAAARCHVSQPSLSAQIAQLERALDVPLFERSRRKVLVTAAGRALIERARRLLVDADDLAAAGQRASDPFAGTLRVGVIPTLAPYLLPAVAPALRAAFPRLVLAWREEKTEVLVAALEAGALDAALVALEADLGAVEHEVVARDPFVLAVPADHPLARRSGPVDAGDLRGAEVLLLDDGHCFRDQALEVCASSRAREGEFRATSLTTLVQMVAGGAGLTMLPSIAVATEVGRAAVRVRPLASSHAHRTIALVWRKHSPLAPALRKLAAVVRAATPKPALPRSARAR